MIHTKAIVQCYYVSPVPLFSIANGYKFEETFPISSQMTKYPVASNLGWFSLRECCNAITMFLIDAIIRQRLDYRE